MLGQIGMDLVQSQTQASKLAQRSKHSIRLRRGANYLFVAPMLLYMVITTGYSIFVNIQTSLYAVNVSTLLSGNARFVGFDNYLNLLQNPAFLKSFGLSFLFTTLSISFQLCAGFALALFFNRPFPGNGLLRAMLLLAWLLPAVVVGNIFRWLLDGDYGVFNYIFQSIGLLQSKEYWLLNNHTALLGTIFANAWVGIPFNMMLLLAGLQNISPTLYEAASIDGADAVRRFLQITLPQMKAVIAGLVLLTFIYTFKVFDLIYVMTAGGPVDSTTVLPIYIYKLTFGFFRFGEGAAAALLLLLGLLFLAIGYSQLSQREEAA